MRRAISLLELVLIWALAVIVSPGCSVSTGTDSEVVARGGGKSFSLPTDRRLTIVTTCGMVTDIVERVVGERAAVSGLMGEGVDPHMYKPTRNDTRQLLDADVVFYSGLMLEGRMSDTFAQIARTGKPVFAVSEGLDESYLREPAEFGGHYDPHVWMDVKAWSDCVRFVAKTMSELDPGSSSQYSSNVESYCGELQKLDEYARQSIASIPEEQRVLVTAHDAFGYFSQAYKIDVRSVQGISTESQAGVDDINKLVSFLVDRKIKAIFIESSVSEKNIRAIIEGAASRGWEVKVGGELFSDAMGAEGSYEGTYIGMMDHNITVITRALGGSAPEKGLHGKLSLQHGP